MFILKIENDTLKVESFFPAKKKRKKKKVESFFFFPLFHEALICS